MADSEAALETEAAFYRAFERGDIEAMMRLWLPAGKVLCIHPMGPELIDLGAIRASWEEIFAAPFQRSISIEVSFDERADDLRVRTVQEIFSMPGRSMRSAPVVATNVFQRFDGRWYISVHHASPGVVAERERRPADSEPIPITRH